MGIRAKLPYAIFQLIMYISLFLSTAYMAARLLWWQVGGGRKAKFYGLTLVKKHPESKLVIGDECVFRSSKRANSAGIKQPCFLSTSKNSVLTIGNSCGFSGTVISAGQAITIGNRVMCGVNTAIIDSDRHAVKATERFSGDIGKSAAIVIEDDVWLGMNVVVLKGVTIGRGAVVAANSVVCNDVQPQTMVAGNPAKLIKEVR